jgi:23S rRNA (uracil1939-C5)-methyltransferase
MESIIELMLDGIAHGGEALGRHSGKVVFVPYALPGERVRVEIVEEKERWARARLIEVLAASPDRVEPPCPYFGPGLCGGCQWQHIAYERQVALKGEIVADQLQRLGHLKNPPVDDAMALADDEGLLDYGYRNHTQFAMTAEGHVGYRRAASHDVLAIDRCLLLAPLLDDIHGALDISYSGLTGITLRAGLNTGQGLVLFETAAEDVPELEIDLPVACAARTKAGVQPMIGQPYIEEEVAGRRYRVAAESFFQVNTAGAEALVDLTVSYLAAGTDDVVLDAYCGVGLFALALAGQVAEVIGIESSPSAVEDLAYNAGELANITLHEGSVEEVLPALVEQGQRVDLVIMDPPRAGAGEPVIRGVAALGPRRIVYVSCDPATLARDAVYLVAAGYRLREAQPVDMFPQTFHVETVAAWDKSSA